MTVDVATQTDAFDRQAAAPKRREIPGIGGYRFSLSGPYAAWGSREAFDEVARVAVTSHPSEPSVWVRSFLTSLGRFESRADRQLYTRQIAPVLEQEMFVERQYTADLQAYLFGGKRQLAVLQLTPTVGRLDIALQRLWEFRNAQYATDEETGTRAFVADVFGGRNGSILWQKISECAAGKDAEYLAAMLTTMDTLIHDQLRTVALYYVSVLPYRKTQRLNKPDYNCQAAILKDVSFQALNRFLTGGAQVLGAAVPLEQILPKAMAQLQRIVKGDLQSIYEDRTIIVQRVEKPVAAPGKEQILQTLAEYRDMVSAMSVDDLIHLGTYRLVDNIDYAGKEPSDDWMLFQALLGYQTVNLNPEVEDLALKAQQSPRLYALYRVRLMAQAGREELVRIFDEVIDRVGDGSYDPKNALEYVQRDASRISVRSIPMISKAHMLPMYSVEH